MKQGKPDIAPMSQDQRNEAILLWQIQDTLLQSYRILFMTFQAIAITAGGFVSFQLTGGGVWDLLHISVIGFLILAGPVFILAVWIPIVSHRHRMVSFTQWLLRTNTAHETPPFNLLGQFSDGRSTYHQTIIARDDFQSFLKGPTRMKLDRAVPIAFIFFWVLLILWKILGAA
jgi:hypothetical protein